MIYNPEVGFDSGFPLNTTPVHRRIKKFIGWAKGILSQSKRSSDVFKSYIEGTQGNHYSNLLSYVIEAEVIYNYRVYKNLIANNIGNNPAANPDKWQLISPSFIGVSERSTFTGQKLILEYALNRYFGHELALEGFPGFRQPDHPITPTNSDIFIENVAIAYTSFVIYDTEVNSSVIYDDGSTGYIFGVETYTNPSSYLFNVNIPSLVYARIGTPAIAEKIVRNFVDKYIPIGVDYNIITY